MQVQLKKDNVINKARTMLNNINKKVRSHRIKKSYISMRLGKVSSTMPQLLSTKMVKLKKQFYAIKNCNIKNLQTEFAKFKGLHQNITNAFL